MSHMEQLRIEIPELDAFERESNEAYAKLQEVGGIGLLACHVSDLVSPDEERRKVRDYIESLAEVGIAKGYIKRPIEREEV